MQKIIDIVLKYKELISFFALVIISLSLISLGGSTKIGGFRALVIGSVGWAQEIFSFIPNTESLKSENQSLRELNLQLSNDVTRMRRALLENKSLRQALGYKEDIKAPYVLAEVIGKASKFMKTYLTVNKGKNDGIQAGMAVRTDAGLVGNVIGASDNYAYIDLINNPGASIAAKAVSSHADGSLDWESGNTFIMKYVPKNSGVEIGGLVVTSGFSAKYPEKIPIGRITKIDEDPGGINLIIEVELSVDFNSLDQLFILRYLPDPELQELIRDMDIKLQARQNQGNQ